MEFFAEQEMQGVDIGAMKDRLRISRLPTLCQSIDSVLSEDGDTGEIYCLWGQFRVSREEIRYGVRFALLDCPHALAWTITYHADRKMLVVHCTIDDREESEEFVESIEKFVSDWGIGLKNALLEGS